MPLSEWYEQAKNVTKKFSDLMYSPSVDLDENLDEVKQVKENEDDLSDAMGIDISVAEESVDENSEEVANDTVEKAKRMAGSFLSFAKEATAIATATAEETAKKLQNIAYEKTVFGTLDKEQTKFRTEVAANELVIGSLPWSDLPDQSIAKKQILTLSLDKRNFIRSAPAEALFDVVGMQKVAMALLKEDPNLCKVRYHCVPKFVSEEQFWKNYFYRICLIRESILKENNMTDEWSICLRRGDNKNENDEAGVIGATSKIEEARTEAEVSNENVKIAEELVAEEAIIKELRETVENAHQKKSDEDWEKELENEICDYELINEQSNGSSTQWEEEIAELLDMP